jgi:hypothetical protein
MTSTVLTMAMAISHLEPQPTPPEEDRLEADGETDDELFTVVKRRLPR